MIKFIFYSKVNLNNIMKFIEEIRKSRAFKLTASYLGICFVLLQILDPLAEREIIDNELFTYIVYLSIAGTIVPLLFGLFRDWSYVKRFGKTTYLNVKVLLSFSILFIIFYLSIKNIELKQSSKNLISLESSLEQIIKKWEAKENLFVFHKTKELLVDFPENKLLKLYFDKVTYPTYISIKPESLPVYIRYADQNNWIELKDNPIDSLYVPWTYGGKSFQLKFKLKNRFIFSTYDRSGQFNFDRVEEFPLDHAIMPSVENNMMTLPGINFDNISLETFSISKTEVTNKEFQEFVNDGGYKDSTFWDFPIIIDGINYTFSNSMGRFTDKHGQAGPKNWSYGRFNNDIKDHPVTGVSWFEARAYAKYKDLKLPNIFQWLTAAGLSGFVSDLPDISKCNLKSTHLWDAKDSRGSNIFEIKNIAGNVREWTTNPNGESNDKYSILGGSYFDNSYSFNDYYSLSPFDRSVGNGFRVAKSSSLDNSDIADNMVINFNNRNILLDDDVSDEVFSIYKNQFNYEPYDLDTKIDTIYKNTDYITYRYQLTPAYKSDEELHGYVIYSKQSKLPLKPIIQFPTAGAIFNETDEGIIDNAIQEYNYLLVEGYAIICPVYYSTSNRKKTINTWWANESDEYKSTIIHIGKDYKRSIDFICSKEEFESKNLSYIGYSWGSIMSNIMLAIDDRVQFAFICAGGLQVQRSKQEIDPAIFTRRITIPVMSITGKNDGIFDYENSQVPMQKLLGTPLKDQEIIVLNNVGHLIPQDVMIENHLKWLKKYIK